MNEPLLSDEYYTSSSNYIDENDVIISHQEYFGTYYTYETCRTFVEICMDMGLNDDIPFRLM